MQSRKCQFVGGRQRRIVLFAAGVFLVELGIVPCRAQDPTDWYAFAPRNTAEPGEIGMQDWTEKPAGHRAGSRRFADRKDHPC